MLIILLFFALIQTLHGVPLSSPLEARDLFTDLNPRETQGHFGQRGVNDIIVSCIATIFACTWSAVHPNIPAVTDSSWTCFKRRVTITIYALVAPELMTYWAMNQYMSAKRIVVKYNDDLGKEYLAYTEFGSAFRALNSRFEDIFDTIYSLFQDSQQPNVLVAGKGPRWTLAHGFCLQMGGFIMCENGIPTQILTVEDNETGITSNILNGTLDPPRITEEDIKDRSKGDTISKTFVILQTTWFIIQCIARWWQHLPVTELEVVTLGFAMLNGIIYSLWWHKPQNVGRPVFLERKKTQGGLNKNPGRTSIVGALDAGSQPNPLLRPATPGKESWLRCRLREDMENYAPSPTLLWRLPYRIIQAFLRPLRKMMFNTKITKTRVGMFHSLYTGGTRSEYATAAIGILFGSVHLIPTWFLDFSSRQELRLWRISAFIITAEPILWGFNVYLNSINRTFLAIIFGLPLFIGFLLYPIARAILLILSLTSLRSLPPAALKTIKWTTFIPHL